jgi:putative endopeptidase
MNMKYSLPLAAFLLALAGPASADPGAKGSTVSRKLLDPANIDNTVKPGENFYRYANGAWLKNNPIPGDQTRWGSFNELQENNYKALHILLESATAAHGVKGSREQMVGDFYKSGMDSLAIEKAGLSPLAGYLSRIEKIQDAEGVIREVAIEHTIGLNTLFGFNISPDDKEVTKEICQFYQGGLGMPDRDYYFKTDARSTKVREAYKKYLVLLMKMTGSQSVEAAEQDAADEYKLEETLAGASMTRVEMRDPYNVYHKFSLAGMNAETPGMDWVRMVTYLRIPNKDSIIVGQPKFFATVGQQLKSTPLRVWKKYLQTQMVMAMSPYLSSTFVNARFEFSGRTLRGQQEQQPRWKRVLNMVDGNVGELLGHMYVDKNFKPEAKQRMLALVNNLQQTYADRIRRLDWMTPETKTRALH